LLIFDYL